MPKILINLLKQNNTYLVVSCLVFPFSLKIYLLCFTYFLIIRILPFDSFKLKNKQDKSTFLIKIALSVAIVLATIDFYIESLTHFYPVSYYDYLFVVIVTLIIKLYPLKKKEREQIFLAIAFSPIVVFVRHLSSANFHYRNAWGFYNPNGLGLYCAICLPLIACCLISLCYGDRFLERRKKSRNKIIFILPCISLLTCSIMLISSGSRSSLYTTVLSVMIIFLLYYKKILELYSKHYINYLQTKYLFCYSFFCLGLLSILYKFVLLKFVFIERFINITNSTNVYRTYIYQCYWQLGWEKPWWGWGMNKVARLCEQRLKSRHGGVNHAHNFILQLFSDRGLVITTLCLIGIIYFVAIPIIQFFKNYNLVYKNITSVGIYLSSLNILVISLFQSSFYHYPLFPLWLGLFWGWQLKYFQHE